MEHLRQVNEEFKKELLQTDKLPYSKEVISKEIHKVCREKLISDKVIVGSLFVFIILFVSTMYYKNSLVNELNLENREQKIEKVMSVATEGQKIEIITSELNAIKQNLLYSPEEIDEVLYKATSDFKKLEDFGVFLLNDANKDFPVRRKILLNKINEIRLLVNNDNDARFILVFLRNQIKNPDDKITNLIGNNDYKTIWKTYFKEINSENREVPKHFKYYLELSKKE